MDAPQILRVLSNAQVAHNGGDFVNALKFYEQFFDEALVQDPTGLYGVRLSYCLDGWAKLAQSFPGALIRLREKQAETLANYYANRNPERFHDYLQISARLSDSEAAINTFIQLQTDHPKSAAKLSKFVWQELITHEQWGVCNSLLEQPSLKLDELFAVFDEANRMGDIDPAFNTTEFEQHTVEQLLSNLHDLVCVLRHGNRSAELEELERQFFQGIQSRDHATLNKQVNAKGAYLFSAH